MKIQEPEPEPSNIDFCSICNESLGDIFLCGDGSVCIGCFSKYSGLSEEKAFFSENVTPQMKAIFRVNRNEEVSPR